MGTWTATTANYTAGTTGGNDKGMIAVCIENDGGKVPTAVTFGGESMTLAESNIEDTSLSTSIWYIYETGNTSVFTGSQAISPTWSGGTPTNVQYHAATYDNVKQSQVLETAKDSNTQTTGSSSVS